MNNLFEREEKIKDRIIVALDVDDEVKALDVIEELKNVINFYKVGLELFLAEGKNIVNILKALNKKVFLDLKFFDIPNTVYKAAKQALRLNPEMLTLHCLGGKEMLKSAVKAKKEIDAQTKILGVTLLTSMEINDLNAKDTSMFVLTMAKQALESGLDGVICSPCDAAFLREKLGSDFLIVCPGVRLKVMKDDQKRVGTPDKAIKDGANYLVIGRPIINANDKLLAANNIIDLIR